MTTADLLQLGSVFLRRDALAAGFNDRTLRRAIRDGALERRQNGVYAEREWWSKATPEQRHVAVAHAVARRLGSPYVYSHLTAALLHGLPVWGVDLGHLHLTHLGPAGGRRQANVIHHATPHAGDGMVRIDKLPVTGVARTVVDFAKTTDVERGSIVADAALAKGLVTRRELVEQAAAQDHDPRTLHVRLVVRGADGGAQSAGETRSRFLFARIGLPAPVLQFEVRDACGQLLGIVDFAWPEYGVIVEFDGKVKYTRFVREGESAIDVLMREKGREDAIREATGWTVIRLTWDDLDHPNRTAERLRRAFQGPRRPAA